MINSKEEFIKSFLPESVKDLDYAQINLDITDLSLSDILRNIHKTYPLNSRLRNSIVSGQLVVTVLCKTDTLEPLKGLFLLITNDELNFEIISSNYVVLCISESNIKTDEDISDVVEKVTRYLANNFDGVISNLGDFYRKYVYDPYELEDDYVTEDGFYV
jgi:hypothetical protein